MVISSGVPGPPRIGLVVSKGDGGAVTRNRIKRRLRHAIAGLQLQPGHDYVIIASRQVNQVAFSDLENWLDRAVAAGSVL